MVSDIMNYSYIENGSLDLSRVTLCAVTSVNTMATISAIKKTKRNINFHSCKLFTDMDINDDDIEIIKIEKIKSSKEYSEFIIFNLPDKIETEHCMIVQWDGHVIDYARWRDDFDKYDYIGASWPQFQDGYNVGNGGFSLRSRRLMEACRDKEFHLSHPEDVAIGRQNREWLEKRGMRFAPCALADQFSTERAGDLETSFGYHGAWNMPRAIGLEAFWNIYRELDDRSTISHDLYAILKDVFGGKNGLLRCARMIFDHYQNKIRGG